MLFRTVQLLFLLALLGFPVSWLLLDGRDKSSAAHVRIMLAPLTGLACVAIGGSALYAVGVPIDAIVGPFWVAVAVCWLALLVRHGPSLIRARLGRPIAWPVAPVASALAVAIGATVVGLVYLWPFLQDPQLVFWHYSGSDGYMYMRIAEYLRASGSSHDPTVGLHDAASAGCWKRCCTSTPICSSTSLAR